MFLFEYFVLILLVFLELEFSIKKNRANIVRVIFVNSFIKQLKKSLLNLFIKVNLILIKFYLFL